MKLGFQQEYNVVFYKILYTIGAEQNVLLYVLIRFPFFMMECMGFSFCHKQKRDILNKEQYTILFFVNNDMVKILYFQNERTDTFERYTTKKK